MAINKEKFKAACERSGVQIVHYRKADRTNYADVMKYIVPPVVIKPVDNSGARGVFKCFDSSEMNHYAEKALSFSRSGEILFERAMNPDSEFSVYYIMNHGQYYLTAMGDRYVNTTESNIAPIGEGMMFPSVHLEEWKSKMDVSVKKFFADNDMKNGFVFLQGFYEDGEFYLHEIGYRLNGGFSYKIVEHFSGCNHIQELIKFSLTGSMDDEQLRNSNPDFKGYGMIITLSLKPGVIGHISGMQEIGKVKGVIGVYQLHDAGEELLVHGTTAQVFAYILCTAETENEIKDIVKFVADAVKVSDINGRNLLNPIIEPSKINFRR